jgi:cytochrome c biogenesis protein CcmG/thiol:disulfide interchange protein DsbE
VGPILRNRSTVTEVVSARKSKLLPALVALAGACVVALLIYGVAAQSANRTLDERVASGRFPPAPDAARQLPRLGVPGRAGLASYRGGVVVLNFWASWCEPCRIEAPLLERAQRGLRPLGGTVLGVTHLDASPDSEAFVRRYRLTYPQLRDSEGAFAHAYGTNQLPESFIIDPAGRVVAISRGEIGEPFLQRALALARGT